MISDQGTLSPHRLVLLLLLPAPAPWPRWEAPRAQAVGPVLAGTLGGRNSTPKPLRPLLSKTIPPCPHGNIQRSGQSPDLLPLNTPSSPPSDIPTLFVLQGRALNWGEAGRSGSQLSPPAAAFGCYESCIHNTAATDIIDPAGAKALKSLRTHTHNSTLWNGHQCL